MDLLLEGKETQRLLFRKVIPSDFDLWLPFHEDKRSNQFWEGLPKDPKIACQQQFDRIFERYENNLGGMNALISKSTGEFIGLCGLLKQTVDSIEELEIGYSILPKYWRQGYASEAALACKKYAKHSQLADSLISIIQVDNIPSQKVALTNGMHLDKTTTYHNNTVHIFRVLL
ncbi:GNAT family N-acetyltransferase [Zobellia sp. B3R18]|uniref:GNAT family N-acetyltransferase n=1 Tax=Zobellia sp. B3R18 TaxID=2841568 RepID=UPI001C0676A9|nr:GNAT family N-acetyltransferase [Zobellia sp. B3R18]MBU2973768.1 GNAT family N-acetyltransferase [Zobellia sp. B3R18]